MRSHIRTASLAVALVFAGTIGQVQAQVTVHADTSSAIHITRGPRTNLESLKVQTIASLGDPIASVVRYSQNGVVVFSATVSVENDAEYSVTGDIAGTRFSNGTTALGQGAFQSSYTFGQSTFVLEVPVGGPSLSTTEGFAQFRAQASADPQAVADQMATFLAEASQLSLTNDYLLNHAIVALQATGIVDQSVGLMGMIDDYYDCVEDACTESGACWNPNNVIACQLCPGTGFWEGVAIAILYDIASASCILSTPICQALCPDLP